MRTTIWLGMVLAASALALAGCGSDDSGGSSAAATSGTSTTGSGGAGGGGSKLNGCDASTATDETGKAEVVVSLSGLTYSPSCFKADAGTKMTVNIDFSLHPLRGGTVTGDGLDAKAAPDSSSPIQATDTGMTASFTLASAGDYGFYCQNHFTVGMTGAAFVQ